MVIRAQISEHGGPEVITWIDEELPAPGADEVRMRNTAVGLNFIDIYHRSGGYPVPLPSGLGLEAAGIVEAIGDEVTDFAVGDRICTFGPTLGAYASGRNIAASALFKIPDGVSDETAAAAILKACTVEALVERCAKVETGWTVLVHAAAGGVGLLLTQWLKHIGAHVIGTVSTAEKAAMAKAAGADNVILTSEDIAKQVRELTGGKGVQASFDGVGADSWEASLKAVAPRGMIVSFGNASGPVTGVALGELAANGSLFVTRPTLFHYYTDPVEQIAGAKRVFDMLGSGALRVSINQQYPLKEAAQAQRDLEARLTTGSTILVP